VVGVNDVKQGDTKTIEFVSEGKKPIVKGSSGIFEKLGQLVQKAINCCKE
jgi:hypothetical protein